MMKKQCASAVHVNNTHFAGWYLRNHEKRTTGELRLKLNHMLFQ